MTKRKLNRIGYITAALTFIIASYILFAHYHGFKGNYEFYGLLFIPVAFILNASVLIFMLFYGHAKGVKGPYYSVYAMVFNVPYAIFCLWFAIYLNGFYRVTIINDTSATVKNIQLTGCDNAAVKQLKPGASETVWIEISGDCSLDIRFTDKRGNTKRDNVASYLTSGMGQLEEYHISGRGNPRY